MSKKGRRDSSTYSMIILATALILIAPTLVSVHGDPAPNPMSYPSAMWVPSGPASDVLRYQVYANAGNEFNDFSANLDMTDSQVPFSLLPSFRNSGSALVTSPQAEYDVNGFDFKMNLSFWGIPFDHGNSPAGIELRQGIAHLINKDRFIIYDVQSHSAGYGDRTDCFAPQLQVDAGYPKCPGSQDQNMPPNGNIPSWNVCSWDTLNQNCFSAFNFNEASSSSNNGVVDVGSTDFCAAADHFIRAFQLANVMGNDGQPVRKGDGCVLQNAPTLSQNGPAYGPIYILGPQSGSAPGGGALNDLAAALTIGINSLMKQPAAAYLCTAGDGVDGLMGAETHNLLPDTLEYPHSVKSQMSDIIWGAINNWYRTTPCSGDWNIAATSWRLNSAFDQFAAYNTRSAGNGYSNANLDYWTNVLEQTGNVTLAVGAAQSAEYIMGSSVVNLPIWSDAGQFAYRNGWTGVIQENGRGPSSYWTALNAWNPTPPTYGPTIRWGLGSVTSRLNALTSVTSTERLILSEIYEPLLVQNPYNPGQYLGWMANYYQSLLPGSPNCPVTYTNSRGAFSVGACVMIQLKADISWHDILHCQPSDSFCLESHVVTASDVKFSFLNFVPQGLIDVTYNPSQLPSAAFSSYGGTKGMGETESLFILLDNPSVFTYDRIVSVPILPQHLWHCLYSGCSSSGPVVDGAAPCVDAGSETCAVDPSYLNGPGADPVLSHRLVGSGPFVCASGSLGNAGTVIGGGCTFDSQAQPTGAAIPVGGTAVLRRFSITVNPAGFTTNTLDHLYAYFRTNAKFLQFQWAAYPGGSAVPANAFTVAIAACKPNAGAVGGVINYAGCQHYNTPSAGLACVSTAGACIGAAGGGRGSLPANPTPILIQISYWRNNGPWTFGVASYLALDGAQILPLALHEDGSSEGSFSVSATSSTISTGAGNVGSSNIQVTLSTGTNGNFEGTTTVTLSAVASSGLSFTLGPYTSFTLSPTSPSGTAQLAVSAPTAGTYTIIVLTSAPSYPSQTITIQVNVT